MSSATKRALLITAAVILVLAAVWRVIIDVRSPLRSVCESVNRFGYSVSPDDFFLQGYGDNTCIRDILAGELTDEETEHIVSLSQECGFGGDIEKTGRIELLLWQMDEDRVMIIYTADGIPELVFIETVSTGAASGIDGRAAQ